MNTTTRTLKTLAAETFSNGTKTRTGNAARQIAQATLQHTVELAVRRERFTGGPRQRDILRALRILRRGGYIKPVSFRSVRDGRVQPSGINS